MKIGYINANTTEELEKQILKLSKNGISLIYKEKSKEKIILKELLKEIKPNNILVIAELKVLGKSPLKIIRELEEKGASLQSIKEDWNEIFNSETKESKSINNKRWSGYKNKVELVIALEKNNYSVKEIAELTGLSKTTVYKKIKENHKERI